MSRLSVAVAVAVAVTPQKDTQVSGSSYGAVSVVRITTSLLGCRRGLSSFPFQLQVAVAGPSCRSSSSAADGSRK